MNQYLMQTIVDVKCIASALNKGKAEGIETMMALNMLKDNKPINKISESTDLSEDVILELKKKI